MNKNNKTGGTDRSPLQRAAPLLAFLLAICILVICCHDSGHTSLPPTEKRYVTAKAGITALRQDKKQNMLREPWEKLATEFRSIYDADPDWPNRPAALFRAAESLEELAKRSFARQDARKAITCYETLALRHAQSRLADDALFRAAQMRAAWLKDDSGALALISRIKKQYPKGDMLEKADALEKAIKASANGKTAPEAIKTAASPAGDAFDDVAQPTAKKGREAVGNLPLRLKGAKSRSAALQKDPLKSCWRQPWENLREEFLAISRAGKKNIVPEAMFEAAACQEKIAVCSRLSQDSKKSAAMYNEAATRHPRHHLADDALLKSAKLNASFPAGKNMALKSLDRLLSSYPTSQLAKEARNLKAKLDPGAKNAVAKTLAEKSELQVLSWDSINKNRVEIILEMSAPTKYAARLEKGNQSVPPRLIVDLENADVVNDVRKGVAVNGSLLKAVRVKDRKEGASLQFDFREVKRFDTRSESDPCRIIVSVAAGNASLPRDKNVKRALQAQKSRATVKAGFKTTQVCDLASQLGLTVQRVFIDAGHGGKDPGTAHNKVVEKDITLDIAIMLGRLLEANGLEVIYSRKTNRAVALSERTRLANSARADLFVSIHVNANDNQAANGFETYYLDLASNSQAARVAMLENASSDRRLGDMQSMLAEVMLHAKANESRSLATDIQRVALFRLKKRDFQVRSNGVKSAPFHVLLGARMPAVLVEVGYCSNAREAERLATAKYRQAIAEGLAEGVLAYRDRLLRNRTANSKLTRQKSDAI